MSTDGYRVPAALVAIERELVDELQNAAVDTIAPLESRCSGRMA